MPTVKRYAGRSLRTWLALAVGLWVLAGCAALCTKHLYLYREAPQKQPPAQVALVITDPNLVQAVMPGANLNLQGAPWAPLQPSYTSEMYRLQIEKVDGQKVYQGMCLDYLPIFAVELKPGSRGLAVRADLMGPEGQEKFTDTAQVDLQAGQVYFLRPDWQELLSKRLVIKAEPLPEAYTDSLRARFVDRQKVTDKTASLD
ncbi:MAG: hypothetical protein NTW80_01400 [Deltaproteobacteria bacterium]|nr:hypothetical protein [Deltaproteobacteria bacterium]